MFFHLHQNLARAAACSLALILTGSAWGAAELPEPTHADIAYGDHPRQVLDFYRAESDEPAPAVIYLHGGAWSNGDKTDIRKRDFDKCLDAGISVISINYRFVSQAQKAGGKPPVAWPMRDAARALQFVRAHAEAWNIDAERIAMSGTSAGACTSLWIAFHDDMAEPESADPVARQSTRLYCAAVYGAQTSLDPEQLRAWTPNSNYGGHAFGFRGKRDEQFKKFLAGRDEVLPWIREYSPIEHASADDPPVFLLYDRGPDLGKRQKDPTHSANLGVGLREKLDELGVSCELAYPRALENPHASMEEFLIDRLSAATPVSKQAGEIELPAKENFRIYLLMGQSNMAGRDRRELDKQKDNPRVLALDDEGNWKVARDPIHSKRGRTKPGEGPGIAFGEAMVAANPGVTVGLIPCAIGGSPLDSWRKGEDYYEQAVARAREASEDGVLSGVLWHQGETDAANSRRAGRYADRLKSMFATLRKDLGDPNLPIVVGEIGEFLNPKKQPHADAVQAQIRRVAEDDSKVGVAASEGLSDKGDDLHFSAEGSRELGRRFAEAMQALSSKPVKVALVGDSTMCEYAENRRGRGMFLEEAFTPGSVEVGNFAKSGRSTKTFIKEKRWAKTLAWKPDYVFIQFGHNDSHDPENPESTDAATDYRDFLRRYIDDSRAIGAVPIFVTPMVRRTFLEDGKLDDNLKPYAEAMKEVAKEKKIAVIDLHTSSWKLIEPLGPEGAGKFANKRGDRTHFNEKGARAMVILVLAELPVAAPKLAKRLSAPASIQDSQ